MCFWAFLWMAARGWIEPARYFGICGFQQACGLPCPGCYVTRSAMLFASGHIIESFCLQPAGAVFCGMSVVVAVFALLISVFGVNFSFLQRRITGSVICWAVVAVLIVFAGGWAVTLCRALVESGVP
ncbi:MAG: DUF2752 domain-containing protein [Phycisphaerae bacterium]|nr:DUF2752 domain-containing protein [Phycisphaerae bacterium]